MHVATGVKKMENKCYKLLSSVNEGMNGVAEKRLIGKLNKEYLKQCGKKE